MKKSFLTFMATIAILSSSPLLAMIEENEGNNANSAAQLKKTKDPIEMPKMMSLQLLEQIIEDGYLNTTQGMFKFPANEKDFAQSIYMELNQTHTKFSPAYCAHDDNQLTSYFDTFEPITKNPNWQPEFLESGERNPLWDPSETEILIMPPRILSFTLEKK